MCGFCGFIDLNNSKNPNSIAIMKSMNDAINHRGPDDEGFFIDHDYQIYLAHKRLSILDLSSSGVQPFHSYSDRFVIIFNGEIYNYQELKERITEINWKSTTDTEVLVEHIEKFGLDDTLNKIDGMYSFVLWDKHTKKLYFCRDRAGEKPLYYGVVNNILFFGSELKSFTKHPKFDKEINTQILQDYFANGYIPSPYSIYKNIFKLNPGSLIEIDYEKLQNKDFNFEQHQYWSYKTLAEKKLSIKNNLTEKEYIDRLDLLLNESVSRQMIADVPLGAFLSGGIDSSLITAVMQKQSSIPVKTFTIGFKNQEFNEAPFAKEIANFIGTDHTELYCTIQDAIDIIPKISTLYDEPFADSSQIPTFLLSRLAREHVTVSLSGDAGDELFFGYTRYAVALKVRNYLKFLPKSIRSISIQLLNNTPDFLLKPFLSIILKLFKSLLSKEHTTESVKQRISFLLSISGDIELYQSIITLWKNDDGLLLNENNPAEKFVDNNFLNPKNNNFQKFMTSYDIASYLNDDILVKVDRAAMGVSLETRIPLLSKDILEFSMTVPDKFKYNNGTKKLILHNLLSRYIPKELFERPKMGFGLPINHWIKYELRDWVEDLIDEKSIKDQGILNYNVIREKYNLHLQGIKSSEYYLWPILIFQQWLKDN